MRKDSSDIIRKAIFVFTLIIVLASLVSVVFPALIIRLFSEVHTSFISPFEIGVLPLPLLASNIFIFGIAILYRKNNLPHYFQRSIDFILNFEISRRIAIISVIVILGVYIIFTMDHLTLDESTVWGDYATLVKPVIKQWPNQHDATNNYEITEQLQRHVRAFLLVASDRIFHNDKIIPYMASISLTILTYFITKEISGKRFAGVVSMVVILQSYTFQKYDALATYDNFWIAFYLLSIYALYKKWYLSSISYVLSIFSKIISAPFFLLTLFYAYKLNISRRKKLLILFSYVLAVVISAIIIKLEGNVYQQFVSLNYNSFWTGLAMWADQLRFDYLIELTILPLIVGLYFLSKAGIREADSMMIMIGGMILVGPMLMILQPNLMQPYRMISFVVFFAISVGIMLSKKTIRV